MIFYEIELFEVPKIIFACSVKMTNYKNSFSGIKKFLEFCLIEAGDVVYTYRNSNREIVKEKTFTPILSDLFAETSAYNGQLQEHTTVCANVDYKLTKRSTEEKINTEELNRKIKNGNVFLIPYHVSLENMYQTVLSQLKKIACLNASPRSSDHIIAISEWFSLCRILTDFVLEKLTSQGSSVLPAALIYVNKAKDFIYKNYMDNITVSDIAQNLGISAGYLHSLFKSAVGSGITEYINIYRIEIAKQLIVSRNLPLKDIAELIGVKDPAYLSRLFRKITGVSYEVYKKNLKAYLIEENLTDQIAYI